jgi:hypothetical protein
MGKNPYIIRYTIMTCDRNVCRCTTVLYVHMINTVRGARLSPREEIGLLFVTSARSWQDAGVVEKEWADKH